VLAAARTIHLPVVVPLPRVGVTDKILSEGGDEGERNFGTNRRRI
jgi:hypothetical protein